MMKNEKKINTGTKKCTKEAVLNLQPVTLIFDQERNLHIFCLVTYMYYTFAR